MKKLLTRYYFLLALLLLGATGKTYAVAATPVSYAEKASLERNSGAFSTTALQGYTALENYNTPHFEKQADKIETSNNEEEEEEFSLHKLHFEKKFTSANYAFLSITFAPAAAISADTFTKFCPLGNHFHSLSSRRYVLYEVFRI
ncbi:MAG: hypothetical protein ACO1N9_00085 [Flavobacterium sp.]